MNEIVAQDRAAVAEVMDRLSALRDALLAAEVTHAAEIERTHPANRMSATNLVHYVALRNHDVRKLQSTLASLGLSSLGRSERSVLATIDAVLAGLGAMTGARVAPLVPRLGLDEGAALLARNARRLLGPVREHRSTRIMVTMPSEAADDSALVQNLIDGGMDLARINCAHDDTVAWQRMIDWLRSAQPVDGHTCRIAMDLGGPKLRTGPLVPGPQVVRIAPSRDRLGRVLRGALVELSAEAVRPQDADADGLTHVHIAVDDAEWVQRRERGDWIVLRDSRGARRRWHVLEAVDGSCLAEVNETSYVTTGTELRCDAGTGRGTSPDVVTVGELPPIEEAHRVAHGDRIILTRSLAPADPTPAGEDHRIGCTLQEVFGRARVGERVWLDDGKIGGTIELAGTDEIHVRVTDVRPGGANLRAGKGINFPDTDLSLDALTEKDLRDLRFVAHHTDLVDLSFVRRPEDVERLQDELRLLGAEHVGIVLKIENLAAFTNLPGLLMTAMRSPVVGVMIARGDLAVEVGFERLAEVQEEIMWACEAAHIPVIWATQVLDTLARTGQPSRAEITDAAMSGRAECVMLNKGPHIVEAIRALDSILTRMHAHQDKKRSLMRRLRAWDRML